MTEALWLHSITAGSIWTYKIAILVLGYLIVRLGYNLFIKGVTGKFKFTAEIKGAKTHLISASPGLFLILMGTIVVGIGLYKGLSLETTIQDSSECSPVPEVEDQTLPDLIKPPLRKTPPQENIE